MKKAGIIFFVFLFLLFLPAHFCRAEGDDIDAPDVEIEIPEDIEELLPSEPYAASPDEIISSFSFSNVLKTIISAIEKVFPEVASAFMSVLGLIIVSAVMGALRGSIASKAFGSVMEYVSMLCLAGAVFSFVSALFAEFEAFISQINSFMFSVIPAVSALMLAGGQVTGSLVFGAVLSVAVSVLEALCTSLVLPMLSAVLCISVCSKICGGDMLGGFSGLIKSGVRTVLTFCAAAMCCVLAFQSVIAKSADTAAVKGVKFVLGNAVPVVGGALSDAVGTLASSLGLLKSTVGVVSAAAICLIFALPIVKLLLWKLAFDASVAIATAFSLKKESAFFAEMSEIVGFLAAISASVAVFFIIALTAAVAA
jgi:stage III sporulation protein AE